MEPVISFRNFTFQYHAQKKPTLKEINLDIYPGEKVLIVGPSGSGKSTIGHCINGLIPSSYPGSHEGTVTVGGLDATAAGIFALSGVVGTVLQDPDGQFIGLTVGEDIAFALENECTEQKAMSAAVQKAAGLVGVDGLLRMAPHELSGGQKQRVSLAGIMVNDVDVFLFDEPLANLDPAAGKQTIEMIDELVSDGKRTAVIIEHRLEDVLWRNVDRIILVSEGRIVADLKPDELLCRDLLRENGIREPLYVTALRYAGVGITQEKNPSSVQNLKLNDSDRKLVSDWFEQEKDPSEGKSNEVILTVENLFYGYTKEAEILHGISFAVRKGEMISIAGRNGAGKSTLAKLICGFESPSSGRIVLKGRDITGDTIRQRASSIGYVMQNPNQMISQSMIRDEVALGLQQSGLTADEINRRVDETLKICGLYPFRNWPVSALSFGQKKRVTVASVLVMGPEIIILDEPTAGQDFRHYTEIMDFLCELNRQGVTVMMITHDMHLMLEYTPRTIVLTDGRIIADTSSAAVLCDGELIEKASLKATSLFTLAEECGIKDAVRFTETFIRCDRKERY